MTMSSDAHAPVALNHSQDVGLDELPRDVEARVVSLLNAVDANEREIVLRLLEIGFLPGERVRVVAQGFPGRDPLAVRVGHTTFALRGYEAALIRVAPELSTTKGAT
jgi:ferrous iron transport protein A